MADFFSSFWNILWTALTIFVFIAWLMVLFSIIGDLFRDRSLGGFAKAVWVFFLIFVPALAALVYLIARGGGMNERATQAAQRQQAAANAYIREVASTSIADQLTEAKALLDSGAITAEEYQLIKTKALT